MAENDTMDDESNRSLIVAYLVNQYPKVSHSFIRREIAGVESEGVRVERFSIRKCPDDLVDEADRKEAARTRVVLSVGLAGLLVGLCRVVFSRPVRFLGALRLALKIGRRSDRGTLRHLIYLAEACVLLKWLADVGAEHIHAHFGTNPPAVAMLCHALGGPPFSFTVHGADSFDKPEFLAMTEKISQAAFVAAVSSFGRSQSYRWCGHECWSKIHEVHCGVDNKFLDAEVTAVPDESSFVCVGRLCKEKGQLLLVEAFARLLEESRGCRIVLVGDGEMRPDVEQLIAEHDIEDKVTITGWATSDEVCEHLRAARAMVLPSFLEGLPVVIMEALALGRPVISTYIAGIPELVVPGECGWLVPAGSVDELASAMRDVLDTPVERLNEMGQNGRERVLRNHNAHTEARKLVGLFKANCGTG